MLSFFLLLKLEVSASHGYAVRNYPIPSPHLSKPSVDDEEPHEERHDEDSHQSSHDGEGDPSSTNIIVMDARSLNFWGVVGKIGVLG